MVAVKTLRMNEFWSAGEDLSAFQSAEPCPDCAGERGHHSDPSCPTLRARAAELGVEIRRYGAQKDFVSNPARASAYIGGLGSGKTFAGIARGLKFSQQPMPEGEFHGPRGCIAAINYPVLEDVVLPQFFEMMDGSGLWKTGKQETSWLASKKKARLVANCGCPDRVHCKHEATILFRSLDRPNWMRGLELTWYFIDEGRHVTGNSWKVLWGRLRQTGYEKAGWVCSTPNGFDWMWQKFHPKSQFVTEGAIWFGASTYENADHLPIEYVDELFKEYEGAFLRQEVFGEFIGVTEGAVFFNFAPERCITKVEYRPELVLESMWDFGMGDLGVVSFGQIEWGGKELPSGDTQWVPTARLIGTIAHRDWVSEEWAYAFLAYCDEHFGGRRPSLNVGDPAGRQRAPGKKTSIIDDLAQYGIIISTPPRRPQDYAVKSLLNMMESDRVLVDADHASDLGAAISSHRWKVDDNGNRVGPAAVHDWTCIAAGQRVRTAGGWFPIEDLVGQTPVVWGSDYTGRLVPTRASRVWKTHDAAPLVEVRTRHRQVRCTPEHQFLLRDGSYRRADVLQPGDQLAADRYDDYRVVEVVDAGRGSVYDIEVPETDNFVVEGLVVHNSHYCDGVRYWATHNFTVFPRRDRKPETVPPGPGTMGYLRDRILQDKVTGWLGETKKHPLDDWEPGIIVQQGDRFVTSGE